MNAAQCAPARWPAQAARRILIALEAADLSRLEGELNRVAENRRQRRGLSPDELERLELLEAITEGLAGALDHRRQWLAGDVEGRGEELRLLRHLAEHPG